VATLFIPSVIGKSDVAAFEAAMAGLVRPNATRARMIVGWMAFWKQCWFAPNGIIFSNLKRGSAAMIVPERQLET
jgi:hypothetical protein